MFTGFYGNSPRIARLLKFQTTAGGKWIFQKSNIIPESNTHSVKERRDRELFDLGSLRLPGEHRPRADGALGPRARGTPRVRRAPARAALTAAALLK